MRILQALASEGGATALSSTSASSRIFAWSSRRTATVGGRRRSVADPGTVAKLRAEGSAGGSWRRAGSAHAYETRKPTRPHKAGP